VPEGRRGGIPSMTTGYSGTPLAKKLGFSGQVYAHCVPESVKAEIAETQTVNWVADMGAAKDAYLFLTLRAEMEALLKLGRSLLPDTSTVWISWPKKASKVPTDITEDTIREVCLPMGWVDVKVCAIDAIWSGLKLVVRKELRNTSKAQAA
jgi:hypothetical protein